MSYINFLNHARQRTTKKGLSGASMLALIILSVVSISTSSIFSTSALTDYTFYGIQDSSGSDSSFFHISSNTGQTTDFGPSYDDYDLEASGIHPQTGVYYAIAGNGSHDGRVYSVDKTTGVLTDVGIIPGAIGNNEIQAASFHPDGTLWAAEQEDGLVQISFDNNGQVSAVTAYPGGKDDWEGLAWDNQGQFLYGSEGKKLYLWDPSTQESHLVCDNLKDDTEALEFTPDGILLTAHHGSSSLFSVTLPVSPEGSCSEHALYNTPHDDIETLTFDKEIFDQCANNHPSLAVIIPENSTIQLGESVTFDAVNSYDEDGDELEFLWAVNQLGITNTEEVFIFTPPEAGTYVVTLTVGDQCSADTVWTTVTVGDDLVCELTLTKDDNTDVIFAGETINYTVILENTRTANCTGGGVELQEFYDPRTVFVSSTPSPDNNDNNWNFDTLEPGEVHVVNITVEVSDTVQAGDDDIHNTVCTWAAEFGDKSDINNWICVDEDTPISDPPNQCIDNNAPVPVIDPLDAEITLGDEITFNSFNSSDPEADSLTFEWSVPNTQFQGTGDEFAVSPTSTGEFIIMLKAADQCTETTTQTTLTVNNIPNQCVDNTPPTAAAGEDISAKTQEEITLDASGSSDPNNDTLTYKWEIESLGLTFTDQTINLSIDTEGIYEAVLTVMDGCSQHTDSLFITIENASGEQCVNNQDPVAVAGPDKAATTGDLFTLNATNSHDPNNDELSYLWEIPSIGFSSTDSIVTQNITDTGHYTVKLTVFDQCGQNTDTLDVEIVTSGGGCSGPHCNQQCVNNAVPKARAGSDIAVNIGESFTLDATSSFDSLGELLNYQWTIPSTGFSADTATTSTSITQKGKYIAVLTATDACWQDTDQLEIEVVGGSGGCFGDSCNPDQCIDNSAPVADASQDITVNAGEVFTLIGSASTDLEGNSITYHWEIPSVGFTADSANTSVIIEQLGTHTAVLTVSDQCSVDSDQVQITVKTPPTVLGTNTTFTPPSSSPRAGSALPLADMGIGVLSGLLSIAGMIMIRKRNLLEDYPLVNLLESYQ